MATEYKLPYTGAEINSRLAKIDNMVTSINGTTPDSNGNVSVNVDMSGKEDVGIAANLVSTHNTASDAHNDIRALVGTAQTTADAALPKSGGTMTGALILRDDPKDEMEAVTKKYVDSHSSSGSTTKIIRW